GSRGGHGKAQDASDRSQPRAERPGGRDRQDHGVSEERCAPDRRRQCACGAGKLERQGALRRSGPSRRRVPRHHHPRHGACQGGCGMNQIWPIFKREFAAYFATPLAYVFIVIFLFTMGAFTFYIGHFYDNGVADLGVFFSYHPWLYLFLVPAIAMRLWAEERRTGTMELLLTLPVPIRAAVVGKFLAAWAFTGVALALTFPIWITVNYLGQPDNGVIVASYVGSLLMAGG